MTHPTIAATVPGGIPATDLAVGGSLEALARLGSMLEDLANVHAGRSDAVVSATVADRLGADADIATLRRIARALA